MKRLIFLSLFLCSTAFADVVTIETISNDNVVTTINTNFSRLSNLQGGNIEGSCDGGSTVCNVKADSIFRINMADDADPATFAKETLSITVDTVGSEGSYVYSGCTPATDSDLTSDISACVAYVNGIRVTKSATAQTYTASKDTYVDLSQTGVYTLTAVANGASEPVVAANSARLAKVVTSGTAITSVTDLANRRLPGLLLPAHYRVGMVVSKDSTTTLTVLPGTVEINDTMVNKTTTTTLTISTAGDYAGGSSLRAASTFGYVGIDDDGNIKLHTTAPTHDNYDVSTTVGKKRYATWSSTVYRILGWFYMDPAQLVEGAGNIKEGDVANTIQSHDMSVVTGFSDRTFATDTSKINFYSSGGPLLLTTIVSGDGSSGSDYFESEIWRSNSAINGSGVSSAIIGASKNVTLTSNYLDVNRPQGSVSYTNRNRISGGNINLRKRLMTIQEL